MQKKSFQEAGASVEYIESGSGDPIILLPGLGSDCSLWEGAIPELSKKHHVFSLSLPIYGSKMLQEGRTFNLHTYHEFLEAFLKKNNVKNPIFIGHSLGGLVALSYAHTYPENVRAMALVSVPLSDMSKKAPLLWRATLRLALLHPSVIKTLEVFGKRKEFQTILGNVLFADKSPDIRRRTINFLFNTIPMHAIAACYYEILHTDFRYLIKDLSLPILFIYGTKDMELQSINGTSLYNKVKTGSIAAIDGYHFLPADKPKDIIRVLYRFLEKLH